MEHLGQKPDDLNTGRQQGAVNAAGITTAGLIAGGLTRCANKLLEQLNFLMERYGLK